MKKTNFVVARVGKIKKRKGVTGLGWANRALSQKQDKTPVSRKEDIVLLADDLVDAIRRADRGYFHRNGPTPHMLTAMVNYLDWKRVNNV